MIILDIMRHTYRTIGTFTAFTDVELNFEIVRDGEPFDVTGYTFDLVGIKKNGSEIRQQDLITQTGTNTVHVVLHPMFLDTPGVVQMQLYLISTDLVASAIFNIVVGRSLSADIVEESGVVKILQDVDNYMANVYAKLDYLYQSLEEGTYKADSLNYSEQERRSYEDARRNNELVRLKQEEKRQANEIARVENDKKRDEVINSFLDAEFDRETQESIRQYNEQERIMQEAIRNTDEATRLVNEQIRVDAEYQRILNDVEREKVLEALKLEVVKVEQQESGIADAEYLRQTEEVRRKQAEKIRELKFNMMLERIDQLLGNTGSGSETESGHTHSNFYVLETLTLSKMSEWDAKSEFSGSYIDLTDKPVIPPVVTKVSELENDVPYCTEEYVNQGLQSKSDRGHTHSYTEIEDAPTVPTHISQLQGVDNYATVSDVEALMEIIEDLKLSVSNGKQLIAGALTDKGVITSANESFASMASKIRNLTVGGDIEYEYEDESLVTKSNIPLETLSGEPLIYSTDGILWTSDGHDIMISSEDYISYTESPSDTLVIKEGDSYVTVEGYVLVYVEEETHRVLMSDSNAIITKAGDYIEHK